MLRLWEQVKISLQAVIVTTTAWPLTRQLSEFREIQCRGYLQKVGKTTRIS
jgi:hypothetical protein